MPAIQGGGDGYGRGRHGENRACAGIVGRLLNLSGRDGLWRRAVAAQQTSIPIVVSNTGTAPADQIALSASAPEGWKVTFEPATTSHRTGQGRPSVSA